MPSVKISNLDLNNLFFNDLTKKEFLARCRALYLIWAKEVKDRHSHLRDIAKHGKMYPVAVDCLRGEQFKEFCNPDVYHNLSNPAGSFFMSWGNYFWMIMKQITAKEGKIPKVVQNLLQKNLDTILKQKPDLVGFSIFAENEQLSYALLMAKMLKQKASVPIIFGAAAMSYIDLPEFLEIFDCVDFVIPGEGEIGLTEFIKRFKNKDFKNVPGLFYRDKNRIVLNRQQFMQNLDCLRFPDFGDFKLKRYFSPLPVLPTAFSGGCYWKKCAFCDYHQHYPAAYKTKSVQRFVQEVKYFTAQGIKYFMFADDIISARHLNLISEAIIAGGLSIFFGAMTKPEKAFSSAVLKNIYRAGGRLLLWGVESANQRILDLIKKIAFGDNLMRFSQWYRLYTFLYQDKGTANKDIEDILKNIAVQIMPCYVIARRPCLHVGRRSNLKDPSMAFEIASLAERKQRLARNDDVKSNLEKHMPTEAMALIWTRVIEKISPDWFP